MVFVDLETTGTNFINDRIIEIGIVELNEDGIKEWSSFTNPGRPISPFITNLTGIDSGMVAEAPTFEQLGPVLLEKLKGRLFVAHNARFDYGFLKHEFKRIGINFQATCLCTVKLSRKLFPEHHRHNLDTLIDRFQIAVDDRHRALTDACVLWKLWQRWHELLSIEILHKAIDQIIHFPELPPHVDPSFVDDLPEAPGTYAFYGENDTLLFLKHGANLRRQVLAHFSSQNNRDTQLVHKTRRIDWKETAGKLGAQLHEIALTKPHQRNDELCSWQLLRHDNGLCLRLAFTEEVDFSRSSDLFGLYASRREALHALRKLAEAHRLCPVLMGLDNGKDKSSCAQYQQKNCPGACLDKKSRSLHDARLATALAKYRLQSWPYPGPIALSERDEFGMREDFHVFDSWRYLGTAHTEEALDSFLENWDISTNKGFDANIYRLISKALKTGNLNVIPLFRRTQAITI